MQGIMNEMSSLSGSTVISVIVAVGVFTIVCMVSQVLFKRTIAKWVFVIAVILSQIGSIALAVHQFLSNQKRIECLENATADIANLNAPSLYPLSEKSKMLKTVIEKVMAERGFMPVKYDEDRVGLVSYLSSENSNFPDTFIFVPRYDIERLGRISSDKIETAIIEYLFKEHPFADDGVRSVSEINTDLLGQLNLLIEVISKTPFGWEYNEDGTGYVFFFESLGKVFRVEGTRIRNLALSTRFGLQDRLFKLLAIDGLNAHIQQ